MSDVDVFDTAFVEKVVPKAIDYDDDFDPRAGLDDEDANDDFDPRAGEESLEPPVLKKDLLSTSHTDLASVVPTLAPSAESPAEEEEIDPFDTSAVSALVAPGKTELKYLEQELLANAKKDSLSDDDFDPRAGEEEVKPEIDALRQRKSSLSLQISSSLAPKLVSFAVATPDLLKIEADAGGKKPLTPYYNREPSLTLDEEVADVDPFDTSFVPSIQPSTVELDLIEKEMMKQSVQPQLKPSLSDDDFDPRAVTPVAEKLQSLLTAPDNHDIKVLTPAKNSSSPPDDEVDPFDTSIACNILPGTAELKLLEDELIDKKPEPAPPTDLISDTQDNSIYTKILTPQPTGSLDLDAQEDYDPFDTSFAANLAPGETEMRMMENELIN